MNTIEIYINLLDEGTPTIRPTEAILLPNGFYKVLPTPNYDPENETWEFLPSSIVKCVKSKGSFSGKNRDILLAVENVGWAL